MRLGLEITWLEVHFGLVVVVTCSLLRERDSPEIQAINRYQITCQMEISYLLRSRDSSSSLNGAAPRVMSKLCRRVKRSPVSSDFALTGFRLRRCLRESESDPGSTPSRSRSDTTFDALSLDRSSVSLKIASSAGSGAVTPVDILMLKPLFIRASFRFSISLSSTVSRADCEPAIRLVVCSHTSGPRYSPCSSSLTIVSTVFSSCAMNKPMSPCQPCHRVSACQSEV